MYGVARKKPVEVKAHPGAKRTQLGEGWGKVLESRAPWIAAGLVLVATLRIVATYHIFNHTIDEPAHIACGMEWLDQGKYTLEPLHPPLARVMNALGPYVDGARSAGRPGIYNEGATLLYGQDGTRYDRRLTLARLGTLPFFWLLCGVAYAGCALWLDRRTALAAVFLLTMVPSVLAHSGLATTDIALTATLCAALAALLRVLNKPSLARGALLGLFGGLAILSKLTALAFFAACAASALVFFLIRSRPAVKQAVQAGPRLVAALAVGLLTVGLVVWAGYRFSFGSTPYTQFPLPAPELFGGAAMVLDQAAQGHPAYLLGEISQDGFWYYYPVALMVKLPLPFLALTIFGTVVCWRKKAAPSWVPIAFSIGLLGMALWSTKNIGIRHVLPVVLFFAVVAAVGWIEMLQARKLWVRYAGGALAAWLVLTSAVSHPDYLAYFNALAGNEPERILVDSDLDWGQDMKRLAKRLQEVGARQVWFTPLIVAYLEQVHGFPPIQPANVVAPDPGWTAVSLTVLKATRLGLYQKEPDIDPWPNRIAPRERVGKGVYLYYFPPQRTPGVR